MLEMGPWETGMWKRDSDGGELPDRASGSCHTELINPMTHQEDQPVTCHVVQQVMKAGRMALGWQEPGAVGRKTQEQDVMFTMSPRRHHLWFCSTETAVNTVSAWRWWMCVYCISRIRSVCVCVWLYSVCLVCFCRKHLIWRFLEKLKYRTCFIQ